MRLTCTAAGCSWQTTEADDAFDAVYQLIRHMSNTTRLDPNPARCLAHFAALQDIAGALGPPELETAITQERSS